MALPSLAFLEQLDEPLTTILKKFSAALNTFLKQEHKDDGTHSDVTADSIVVTDLTAENETVTALTVTGDLQVSGNLGVTGAVNAGSVVTSTVLANSSVTTPAIIAGGGVLTVTAATSANFSGAVAVTGALTAASLATTGVVTAGTSIKERGRTTPLGEWITPTFNAGDYTGGGGWTVQAADVTTAAYTLVGKTLTYSTQLVTTSVTGGNPTLSILIPGSFVAAKVMGNACAVVSDNGVVTTGNISVAAAGTTMNIQRTDGANWTAAANTTTIVAQITFEIQ